jgi:hypothetical protein
LLGLPEGLNEDGRYELKESALAKFNPFFFHLSRRNRQLAEEYIQGRRKEAVDLIASVQASYIPINLNSCFSTLKHLALVPEFTKILYCSLYCNLNGEFDKSKSIRN